MYYLHMLYICMHLCMSIAVPCMFSHLDTKHSIKEPIGSHGDKSNEIKTQSSDTTEQQQQQQPIQHWLVRRELS